MADGIFWVHTNVKIECLIFVDAKTHCCWLVNIEVHLKISQTHNTISIGTTSTLLVLWGWELGHVHHVCNRKSNDFKNDDKS